MNSLLTLTAATFVLVSIPGPNVALIIANSLRFRFRAGVMTVLGTTAGVALQLALILVGMAAVIELAADVLVWIKWAGVAYLVALGVYTWRLPPDDLTVAEHSPSVFWRGFVLAVTNPKTLLFNAAFIPQFVPADGASAVDVTAVVAVFLTVLFLGDIVWAAFANSARKALARYGRLRNRLAGGFYTAAGIGLALARQ